MNNASHKLIDAQSKVYFGGKERADKAIELAKFLFPEYAEHMHAYIASAILATAKRFELEHGWDCPGEECRYSRAVMEGNARTAGYGAAEQQPAVHSND